MQSIFTLTRIHQAALFFCGCVVIGIFVAEWFRLLPSIGIVGVATTGLLYSVVHCRIANKRLWPLFGSLLLLFLLHAFAGIQTKAVNMDAYVQDVVLQLPIVALGLGFWLLPAFPSRYLRWLWLLLIGATLLAAMGATINYLLHATEINESYYHSKVMPTEPDHIRFSLIVALAIAAGILLLEHKAVQASWRSWLMGAVIALILFLHLLAVRSGIPQKRVEARRNVSGCLAAVARAELHCFSYIPQ
jgi:O-antigen ligase